MPPRMDLENHMMELVQVKSAILVARSLMANTKVGFQNGGQSLLIYFGMVPLLGPEFARPAIAGFASE